jgi:hypothetical protein
MNKITYRSKIDLWLALIIIGSLLVCPVIGLAILIFGNSASAGGGWLVLAIELIVLLPIIAMVYPLYYRIGDGKLLIHSGLLHWNIPLEGIIEVSPTRSALSAPALSLSLERLKINYRVDQGKTIRTMVISPDNRTGFMQELTRFVPGLEFNENRLIRKTS